VAAIKREPTPPPGPIADLFDRLDDLHSKAGRPSIREIAIRAGHGNISSSTVHNILRRSTVPRWMFVEAFVKALGGAQQREVFLALWEAAWQAANGDVPLRQDPADLPLPAGLAGDSEAGPSPWLQSGAQAREGRGRADGQSRPSLRIWSNEIPSRKPNFTGRAAQLALLSDNLSSRPAHVQVISGDGGIGKTELATEYIHRNIYTYEIIWWIRAEHPDRVRDALIKLGQRLELRQATTDSDRDRTVEAVLKALQSDTRASWLLVFDNAANPLDLQKYIPASRPNGHVIITARQPNWPRQIISADSVEVSPFTEEESVWFLRRTVPSLAEAKGLTAPEDARRVSEGKRLAITLGHLPIAVEHAAAYLVETGESVAEYLTRFTENAHQLLDEQQSDSDLPAPVSGTWAMSITLLTPDAEHLFNLCSFFSPEPIGCDLFLLPVDGIDDPLGVAEFLSSRRRFQAAAAQLHRLSLARFDGARDLIQMHRVVQAVTQRRLQLHRLEVFRAYRAAVDALLARSNPGNPDHASSDQLYDLSLQHLESDYRFLHTDNPALRALVIDQVRRLHLRGGHVEAMKFGQDALQVWRDSLGEDDLQVLALSVEVAIAMYFDNQTADSRDLILKIRPRLERHTDGDGFKAFLLCQNTYGAILRTYSQFPEALELDRSILKPFENVFGANHERTLNVRSNIAVDNRQLGRFRHALATDERTLADRRQTLGEDDLNTLNSSNAVARDKRGLGEYLESLDIARRVVAAFETAHSRENIRWLQACQGFATALRKAGHHWDALQEGEHVLQRCRDYLGMEHMYTLKAAIDLINARRAREDFASAEELARQTHGLCTKPSVPRVLLYTALVNRASVLRVTGRPEEALPYDDEAREGLKTIHGHDHPFTLAANINYASDLAGCGRLGEAIQVGTQALAACRSSFGDSHPDTLMAAANLSIDEAAAGNRADAQRHLKEALDGYERTLTLEHPEARAAARRTRLTAEIEPYDL
jgi:hypothetical protein